MKDGQRMPGMADDSNEERHQCGVDAINGATENDSVNLFPILTDEGF